MFFLILGAFSAICSPLDLAPPLRHAFLGNSLFTAPGRFAFLGVAVHSSPFVCNISSGVLLRTSPSCLSGSPVTYSGLSLRLPRPAHLIHNHPWVARRVGVGLLGLVDPRRVSLFQPLFTTFSHVLFSYVVIALPANHLHPPPFFKMRNF